MKNVVTILVLVFFTWGCQQILSPSAGNESGINFRTDQSSYSLLQDDTISLSIENNTGLKYYITEPSHNLTLAKKTENEWVNIGSWYLTVAIVPEPAPLGSKNIFPKEIPISAIQDAISLQEGQYRFEYILYSDEKADSKNQKVIYTNSFSIQT